jgi:hypothetical protein
MVINQHSSDGAVTIGCSNRYIVITIEFVLGALIRELA